MLKRCVGSRGRSSVARQGYKFRGLYDEDLYSQKEQGLVWDDDECSERRGCPSLLRLRALPHAEGPQFSTRAAPAGQMGTPLPPHLLPPTPKAASYSRHLKQLEHRQHSNGFDLEEVSVLFQVIKLQFCGLQESWKDYPFED